MHSQKSPRPDDWTAPGLRERGSPSRASVRRSVSSNSQVIRPSSEEPETTPLVKEQRSRAALPLLVPSGRAADRCSGACFWMDSERREHDAVASPVALDAGRTSVLLLPRSARPARSLRCVKRGDQRRQVLLRIDPRALVPARRRGVKEPRTEPRASGQLQGRRTTPERPPLQPGRGSGPPTCVSHLDSRGEADHRPTD
jgi:hypothetical protein